MTLSAVLCVPAVLRKKQNPAALLMTLGQRKIINPARPSGHAAKAATKTQTNSRPAKRDRMLRRGGNPRGKVMKEQIFFTVTNDQPEKATVPPYLCAISDGQRCRIYVSIWHTSRKEVVKKLRYAIGKTNCMADLLLSPPLPPPMS